MQRLFTGQHSAAARASGASSLGHSRLLLALLGLHLAEAWAGAEPSTNTAPWYRRQLSGQSRTVFQYRSADGGDDSDFYQHLHVRGRDLANRRVDFYLSGKIHRDLDGASTSVADDPFASVEDTRSASEEYLYQGYIEVHDQARRLRLRGGRQYIDIADSLQIDGAQLIAFETARLGGRVFYGQPVSYYSSVSGDQAGGVSLLGRPWDQNQTRLTCVWYHDDSEEVDDERLGLDIRQRWADEFRGRAQASVLNDDFETAGLDLFYVPLEGDFDCSVSFRRWGGVNGETRAYSPLHRVLGDRAPYSYLSARLSKAILPWLYLSPGCAARLVSSDDEDTSNRDYMRYDLTLAAEPSRAWNASLSCEYWNVDNADSFVGVSGEVRYRHRKLWEISAGTGYFHYEYEQLPGFSGTVDAGDVRLTSDGTRIESSPDSYSYFLRGKWNVSEAVSVEVRGEIEDNSEVNDLGFRGQTALVIRF